MKTEVMTQKKKFKKKGEKKAEVSFGLKLIFWGKETIQIKDNYQ